MGVIAACLPSLRPLAALIWNRCRITPTLMNPTKNVRGPASTTSMRTVWQGPGSKDSVDAVRGFTKLEEYARDGKWGHNADIRGGKHQISEGGGNVSLEELTPPEEGIRVKNEVVITTEEWDYNDRVF
ncbi:MAG: hypothetical protein Q9163_003207 [Psora crenata]